MSNEDLVERLRKRSDIRRSIPRGEPDRISIILEEAAGRIQQLEEECDSLSRALEVYISRDHNAG